MGRFAIQPDTPNHVFLVMLLEAGRARGSELTFRVGVHTPVFPLGWDFSSMSCSASAYVRIAIMALFA